jgi:hypothetical protein
VLDLAGQAQWRQCAKMLEARDDFICMQRDGKIYVAGGGERQCRSITRPPFST